MLKIQTLTPDLGWVFSTRTSELPLAWAELAGYRRRWPSEQHRLVDQHENGSVTVIPDDDSALSFYSDD